MSKRLELGLTSSFFQSDWAFKIDISKCKNFEELLGYLDKVIIENNNVGELFRKMYIIPDKCPLFDVFIPFKGFSQNTVNNYQFNNNFEKELVDILQIIRTTSSSKEKERKLLDWYNSISEDKQEVFLKIINLVYSTYYTYNVSLSAVNDITEEYNGVPDLFLNILSIFEYLGLNDSGEILPKDCKTKIREVYSKATAEQREILRYIIDRDFKIKLSEKSFYNIFHATGKIRIIPYQRCEKMDKLERIQYPALCQRKADGKFQNIIYDVASKTGFTANRSGKLSYFDTIIQELKEFDLETNYFSKIWNIPFVLNGEAVIKVPGCNAPDEIFPREIGNGLLNSFGSRYTTFKTILNKISNSFGKTSINKLVDEMIRYLLEWNQVEKHVHLELWNIVPFSNWLQLDTKFTIIKSKSYLVDFLKNYHEWCTLKNKEIRIYEIESAFVNSEVEVLDLYNENLRKGLEGCVVKNLSANIEHGTSTNGIIKLKDFKECDLRVIGFVPGTGKYLGGIGSLICSSECGSLIVNATGLRDDQKGFRRLDENDSSLGLILIDNWDNEIYNGSIVNVKYNMLSKDKSGKPSLSLPNVVEFRNDVCVAQTYIEIVKGKKEKIKK